MEQRGAGSLEGGRGGRGFGFGRGSGGRRGGRGGRVGRGGARGVMGSRGGGNGHWRPSSEPSGSATPEQLHAQQQQQQQHHQYQHRAHYGSYHHHYYHAHPHHQWGVIKLFRVIKLWDNARMLCVGEGGTFTLDVRSQENQNQFDTEPTSFYCCKVYKKPGKSKDWTLIEFSKLVTFAGIIPFKLVSTPSAGDASDAEAAANTDTNASEKRMVMMYRNRNTETFIDFKFAFKGLLFKHVDELEPALLRMLDRHLTQEKTQGWSAMEVAVFNREFEEATFFEAFWELEKRKTMLPQSKLTTLHQYVAGKVQPLKLTGAENHNWRFFGGDFEQSDEVCTPKLRAMREVYEQLGWELRQQNLLKEVSVTKEIYQELFFILEETVHVNLSLPRFPHKEIQEVQWFDVRDLQSERSNYKTIAGDEWTKPLEVLSSHVPRTTATSYIKSPVKDHTEDANDEEEAEEITESVDEVHVETCEE